MTEEKLISPVIGISGSNADSASVRAMMTQIAGTGAIPIFLGNHGKRDAEADIGKIDALVVMGNNADIDPAAYGAQKNTHTVSETDTADGRVRAEYEERLLRKAVASGMPVLGVCGGMQRINVMCGGTLHQHIPDLVRHNDHAQQEHNIAPFIPVEPILIEKGTSLGSIAGGVTTVYAPGHGSTERTTVMENSMHHQAVDKIGEGLRAAAFAEDKLPSGGRLVEAVEAAPDGKYGKQFLIGVQWHPEFGASPVGARLAANVANAAYEFAQAHDRQHPLTEAIEENKLSALPQLKAADKAAKPGGITEKLLRDRQQAQSTLGAQK